MKYRHTACSHDTNGVVCRWLGKTIQIVLPTGLDIILATTSMRFNYHICDTIYL